MSSVKGFWLKAAGAFFPAALLLSPAWGAAPPQPGTINYIEGQVSMGGQALGEKSAGTAALAPGQSLVTAEGRAEILLSPGVFFRLSDHSSVQMVSAGFADTALTLQTGRAMVEVADMHPGNIRINEGAATTVLTKAGLYDFDANGGQIRVFDGKADVDTAGRRIGVKSGRELNLKAGGKLKAQTFDKNAFADDFYKWGSMRASYLAEANVDTARTYAGGGGYAPSMWNGNGWYWSPGYSAYTYIPADGIFYDPFGWGFYSPWYAFDAPYLGFGYGFGYGGYGYGFARHFGPGYRPPIAANTRGLGVVGHAYSVGRGTVGSFGGGAYRGGAYRGGAMVGHSSGFGGGGFSRGGGFGGGGFHGGGGRGR